MVSDFCWGVLGKNQLDKQKNPFQGLITVDGLETRRAKSMAAVSQNNMSSFWGHVSHEKTHANSM